MRGGSESSERRRLIRPRAVSGDLRRDKGGSWGQCGENCMAGRARGHLNGTKKFSPRWHASQPTCKGRRGSGQSDAPRQGPRKHRGASKYGRGQPPPASYPGGGRRSHGVGDGSGDKSIGQSEVRARRKWGLPRDTRYGAANANRRKKHERMPGDARRVARGRVAPRAYAGQNEQQQTLTKLECRHPPGPNAGPASTIIAIRGAVQCHVPGGGRQSPSERDIIPWTAAAECHC